MTIRQDQSAWSWKAFAGSVLGKALLLSLALHLVGWAAYGPLRRIHWTGYDRLIELLTPKSSRLAPKLMDWLMPKPKAKPVAKETLKSAPAIPPVQIQIVAPEQFLAVDPMRATAEPPPAAKYYSDKNSQAANKEIKKPSDQPNIDGKQTLMPQAEDMARKREVPAPVQNLQPSPPDKQAMVEKHEQPPVEAEPQQEMQAEQKMRPLGGEAPGQLAMAKPVEKKQAGDGLLIMDRGDSDKNQEKKDPRTAKAARPRTLVEARSRMQENSLAGQKMHQEGGVGKRVEFSALDAKATPFGAYDNAVVAAIQQRWYDLLDQSKFSGDVKGRVVLEFRLHANGRITDMTEVESSVKPFFSALCVSAVTDPAPYAKWTPEMRRFFNGDFREVRFTFFYN